MKTTPKDVFLHLLLVATLYVSAFSLGALLFNYADYYLPDPLAPFFGADSIRWFIASLLIIFPAHIVTAKMLAKSFAEDPDKRSSRLRKWLLYLTLFIAAIVLIGDAVALIYNFLGGALTARFILKILIIAAIAGGAFKYFLWELRAAVETTSFQRLFYYASLLIALVAVVGGFFIAGSPFRQRLVNSDHMREGNLSEIQNRILNYWQQKNRLPDGLDQLKDEFSGFVPPHDPETSAPYEYRKTGNLSFELCATFGASSRDDPNWQKERVSYAPVLYPDFNLSSFQHEKGRACFDRTIDPEKYRLNKESPKPM